MELPKSFPFTEAENKWYAYWLEKGFFKSIPDQREPYTIVIPPPNVTGVLHMGHMLNNTIQDGLVRRARMQGKNACWVPGTDHASIATEAKVVQMLAEKGIKKSDLSREEFLKHAWEWKEKYGGIILEQLKKLGASCDWDRTRFTMDEPLSKAVIQVFVDLYNKGKIYRGTRMVNWDPKGLTAVSDEEVIYREVQSNLYYVKYPIVDHPEANASESNELITIATTRPETILGDTAVCVHPDDPRYLHLKGKYALIPFVNRVVPIIFDTYIDMEFGTGALKVTPAHDINDHQLGIKHGLASIDTLSPDGTMSEAAGQYIGEDRFVVRKKIVKDLETAGLLVKTESIKNKVGHSERTQAVIEPKLSVQWFLKMETMAGPALNSVMNDEVKLLPEKFKNTYRHWMENVQDWCISRQLWWGQRIPAYYLPDGSVVVAENREKAEAECIKKYPDANPKLLLQDEDVLDTWFSSWLWPISVFDGFKDSNNKDINYYYPTNDLVTAPEILFFWVARMIMAGFEYRGSKPFSNVYLTGIVRDKQGRKMSKSLGNSPDPLELMARYSADGVRTGMLFCSPAGNDLLFDESLCEQGRNFTNKIWNAYKLLRGWTTTEMAPSAHEISAMEWFQHRLNQASETTDDLFGKYRISEALMCLYKLTWDDFCAWYLESVKPEFGKPVCLEVYNRTLAFFEHILSLLHPFMPFITEEIWQNIAPRSEGSSLVVSSWPSGGNYNVEIIKAFEHASNVVSEIRNFRNASGISPKITLDIFSEDLGLQEYQALICKLANCKLLLQTGKPDGCKPVLAGTTELWIASAGFSSPEEEKKKIIAELEYLKGFQLSVEKKLGNSRFVENAKPEVVENERKKLQDASVKMDKLLQQLQAISQ
ncbi:MAG: valine--tRNA ligase [Bacteroidota bacterium]